MYLTAIDLDILNDFFVFEVASTNSFNQLNDDCNFVLCIYTNLSNTEKLCRSIEFDRHVDKNAQRRREKKSNLIFFFYSPQLIKSPMQYDVYELV